MPYNELQHASLWTDVQYSGVPQSVCQRNQLPVKPLWLQHNQTRFVLSEPRVIFNAQVLGQHPLSRGVFWILFHWFAAAAARRADATEPSEAIPRDNGPNGRKPWTWRLELDERMGRYRTSGTGPRCSAPRSD